ncbi:hypothetical protein AAIH46_13015 [Rhizobium sp. 0TCS1.26]|uniref:hypothetical protein n=1 Tax=Rhizobium sp. 0TCS1.26 TaxID=3142623 RepID=UPI003D2AE9A6
MSVLAFLPMIPIGADGDHPGPFPGSLYREKAESEMALPLAEAAGSFKVLSLLIGYR